MLRKSENIAGGAGLELSRSWEGGGMAEGAKIMKTIESIYFYLEYHPVSARYLLNNHMKVVLR